jgi:MFS family permease
MQTRTPFFYGYLIVIVSFLVMMVFLGLQASFGIFFKPITDTLGWSRTVTSGAFSLSQVAGGFACIAIGGLNDRYGPRLTITLCGILSVLGYFLMSQIQSVWQLYLYYGIIIGIGVGVYVPILSTVAKWFVQRRSMMSGIAFAGTGCGMLIMPPLINWLLSAYDWRVTFIILSIIIFVVSILSALFLKNDPGKIGLTAYGENRLKGNGPTPESRSFTFKEAMKTGAFWLFCLVLFGYGFCFFSLQVHIAPYATDRGISSTEAAVIMAVIGGASIVGQLIFGSLGDRIGYKGAFLAGLVFIVLAIITVLAAKDLWTFWLFAVLLGIAFGNCSTQESPIAAWLFGLGSHGVILGFLAFCFTIGAAVGPLLFGYLYDSTGSYQTAFWIAGAISVAAVILMLFLKKNVSGKTLNAKGQG